MTNYRHLSLDELIVEKDKAVLYQSAASLLSNDAPEKEPYLRLYGLQITCIDTEISRRINAARPKGCIAWVKFCITWLKRML